MAQENNKTTKDLTEPKAASPQWAGEPRPKDFGREEKEFLAREEVKTMEKDVTRLREKEAQRERENVAKIKTVEEIAREKERQTQARISAVERESAEKEARDREERVKRLRAARETKETTLESEKTERSGARTEGFREALKETQTREEEERKRFLERVSTRAEGKMETASTMPEPPTPPSLPVVPPEPPLSPLQKPSFSQKLWIRIVLSLLGVAVLAGISTFLVWYLVVRETAPETEEPAENIEETEEQALVIPPALFYVEDSQTIVAPLFSQTVQEPIEQGLIKRIVIEDAPNNQVLDFKDLFEVFSITAPENFYDKVANDFTLFVYSQEEGNRVGLVVKTTDEEGLADLMTVWESAMKSDLETFFNMLGYDQSFLVPYFKNASYGGASFRFQTFSRQDVGMVYAIYNGYFIFTTSWKSMEKALDRLKEAKASSFFSPNSGAEFVLENMTLKEKIGQLFLIGIDGTALTPETQKIIENVQPGGVLLLKRNVENKAQTENLIRDVQQVSLANIGMPLLIGVDQEGGAICTVGFGQEKTSQSEIATAEQAYNVGLSRGEELKSLGINLNLAPVLDTTKSGDFVFDRSFQKDAKESGILAKALILGQKEASILTAIKHFPGYGDIAFDPEDKLAVVDSTPEVSLFATVAQAQPEFVMTSNVVYSEIDPNLPFSFSEEGIKLLKESVGPGPIIITDDLPQPSLIDRFSLKGVVTLPIQAGVDILTFSNNWGTTLEEATRLLEEAVRNKEISEARINTSVLKIIKLKKAYYEQ